MLIQNEITGNNKWMDLKTTPLEDEQRLIDISP